MATYTTLQNERTGELKKIKVGWSWTLFFFSGVFGIPLFMRRLYVWGGVMIALYLVQILINAALSPGDDITANDVGVMMESYFVGFVGLGLAIFLGVKGNAMTAKNYLEHGWMFAYPEDGDTEYAKQKWSLA